jgi:hypothetical protein
LSDLFKKQTLQEANEEKSQSQPLPLTALKFFKPTKIFGIKAVNFWLLKSAWSGFFKKNWALGMGTTSEARGQ